MIGPASLGRGAMRWFDRLFPDQPPAELGDFTATRRMIPIAVVAIGIGILSGFLALILLKLIALMTNLFFYQRASTDAATPVGHHLGAWVIAVPVAGALLIGLIARYGSERIRGHGIPEALESILIGGSRIQPRLAILKPASAAISIGSGGPFGAEGPIIMTGGAFGSLIAQAFRLTSAERKTLLVAGAAGGMTATFGSPLAGTLLAVGFLLFEWKPRSLVPVVLACTAAMATRWYLLGPGPLFPIAHHPSFIGVPALLACIPVGLAAGLLSAAMTASVYLFEDLFQRHLRRIHWMWWPAIAGVVIGVGGLIEPRALGVGFDSIGDLLSGHLAIGAALALIGVKWLIWSFSLGSGTSGGVLAPLLMLGAGLGTALTGVLPTVSPGFWALIAMGAIVGGTMRSPLTGILFAIEITHDWDAALPIMVAVGVAHTVTVLALRRSILTEKVSRRGFHVTREYAIDPLEVLFVREVMAPPSTGEGLWPATLVAFADETLRTVTHRMATTGVTEMPVVTRDAPELAIGWITLDDVLGARRRHLEDETRRERVIELERLMPWRLLRPRS